MSVAEDETDKLVEDELECDCEAGAEMVNVGFILREGVGGGVIVLVRLPEADRDTLTSNEGLIE